MVNVPLAPVLPSHAGEKLAFNVFRKILNIAAKYLLCTLGLLFTFPGNCFIQKAAKSNLQTVGRVSCVFAVTPL